MAESIAEIGLINPVRVRVVEGAYELIAGNHRVEACRSLGLADIAAFIVHDDDLKAELAMIDENLCRAELGPADLARQTARRKAIYEELHGPGKAIGARAAHKTMGRGDANENFSFASFATDTAKATGQSERIVQLNAERGEKVIEEVLDLIRGTSLDTGLYLDGLKRLSPNDQVHVARRDLAEARARAEAKARAAPGLHRLRADSSMNRARTSGDSSSTIRRRARAPVAAHKPSPDAVSPRRLQRPFRKFAAFRPAAPEIAGQLLPGGVCSHQRGQPKDAAPPPPTPPGWARRSGSHSAA